MHDAHKIDNASSHFFEGEKTLVLAGNPNVGKSVFFNYLTGIYVDVSNFPGTTVDLSTGKYKEFTVIDTPGVYGVSSFNDEERVTRDSIIYGDIILNVIDAMHFERDLFLTQQIIDMGKPIIVALNMMDEVEKSGLTIDVKKLSSLLGVPVIPTSGAKKQGLLEIEKAIEAGGYIGNRIDDVDALIQEAIKRVDTEGEALLILEEDENVLARHGLDKIYAYREHLYTIRRKYVNKIIPLTISNVEDQRSTLVKFGDLMLKPSFGVPILFVILALTFFIIGKLFAQTIVGVTEEIIMGTYYYNFIINLTDGFLSTNTFIGNLLIGEFGLFNHGANLPFGLLLPLVIGFYLIMSLLEDSGLLPRIAVLVDKSLSFIGLNGRAIIPIILGFGCVTVAIITTRILGSRRERFIATMLLSVAIPCSAQLGVIIGIAARLSPSMTIIYIVTIFLVFAILGTLLNKFLPGKSTELLIDIPAIRIPQPTNILKKTFYKSKMFVLEAGPLFLLGAAIITILQDTGWINSITGWFSPITVNFLQLPKEVTNTFIMGIIRRDFGAAGLNSMVLDGLLTQAQVVVSLIVITLFVPCIASIMIIFKERKLSDAILIWVNSFIIAFLVGGIVSKIII